MRERPSPATVPEPPPLDGDVLPPGEFDRSLERGQELLQRGEPRAAVEVLEHALQFQPRHQRGRNLLGLSLFKLGDLGRSESIYRGLIEDHPEDATLRVNLGLVFLKAGSPGDAARCFETAIDLQPNHTKAHNYLGLALAQLGEFGRAKECFDKSGNVPMAEKMAHALGKPLQAVAEGAALRLEAANPFQAATEAPKTAIIGAVKPAQGWVVATPQGVEEQDRSERGQRLAAALDALASARLAGKPEDEQPPEPPRTQSQTNLKPVKPVVGPPAPLAEPPKKTPTLKDAKPVPAPAPAATLVDAKPVLPPPPPDETPTEPNARPITEPTLAAAAAVAVTARMSEHPSALSEYTHQKRLAVPTGGGGFAIGPTEVVLHVHGEMLTRLDGLVASWGSMAVRPELKRFRGKATDKPFGEGARRMLRATGHGRFVISREGRQFTALELGDEPAYFREEVLFAFEESLLFENGRVPSRSGADLHLVHLRGHGRLLLATHGTPRAAEVVKGEPLRIPMDQLVGWHGPNIQPRLVPICEEAPELGVALELAGQGCALVDAPDEPR